jgi:hypothetical protein
LLLAAFNYKRGTFPVNFLLHLEDSVPKVQVEVICYLSSGAFLMAFEKEPLPHVWGLPALHIHAYEFLHTYFYNSTFGDVFI